MSTVELFWAKVEKTDTCWEWAAAKDPRGYGRFDKRLTGSSLAHRVAYELIKGAIPNGLTLDHLCLNHGCVNPDHLDPCTTQENSTRFKPYLATMRPTKHSHCSRGHEWTNEISRIDPKGSRHCRLCDQINSESVAEQRAAERVKRFGYDPGPNARFYVNQGQS